MERLEKVRSRLAKIQCGPLPQSHHNIRGVDPHVFAPVVLSVMNECTRVLQGLVPSVHRPSLVAPEVELEEAMSLPVAKAVALMTTFRLERETPVMALKVEDPPDFEAPPSRIDPVSDGLLCPALIHKIRGGKRAEVRLGRQRKPPEWDAASPPVHNVEILTRPDNISKPRILLMLPRPSHSHPRGVRWRHYCHLHVCPYFSPPSDGPRLRYFR